MKTVCCVGLDRNSNLSRIQSVLGHFNKPHLIPKALVIIKKLVVTHKVRNHLVYAPQTSHEPGVTWFYVSHQRQKLGVPSRKLPSVQEAGQLALSVSPPLPKIQYAWSILSSSKIKLLRGTSTNAKLDTGMTRALPCFLAVFCSRGSSFRINTACAV